jgi:hypothetical protein
MTTTNGSGPNRQHPARPGADPRTETATPRTDSQSAAVHFPSGPPGRIARQTDAVATPSAGPIVDQSAVPTPTPGRASTPRESSPGAEEDGRA